MRLLPIIERYMSLRRQQTALYNEFDLMMRRTPLPIEKYGEFLGSFRGSFTLLHETRHSSTFQICLTAMEEFRAELAAVDDVIAGITKKTQETWTKSTFSSRPRMLQKLLESTSMMLTSSVMEIARRKDEIKALLRQM